MSERSKTEWLQADATLTDDIRKQALNLVPRFQKRRTAEDFTVASRWLVRQRYVNSFMHRVGLLQAQDALQLARDNRSLKCLLAVAQWRTGKIDESLATVAAALGDSVPETERAARVAEILASIREELEPDEWTANPNATHWLQQLTQRLQ